MTARRLLSGWLTVALVAISATASAVVLDPGGNVSLLGSVPAPGVVVTQRVRGFEIELPAGGLMASGSITVRGVELSSGQHRLEYELAVHPDSPGALDFLVLFDFTGFSTDVDFIPGTGDVAPNGVSRTSNGTVLSLFFPQSGPGGAIQPGETSATFYVTTDAASLDFDAALRVQAGTSSSTLLDMPGPSLAPRARVDCTQLGASGIPAPDARISVDSLGSQLLEVSATGGDQHALASPGALREVRDLIPLEDGSLFILQESSMLQARPAAGELELVSLTPPPTLLTRGALAPDGTLVVLDLFSVARIDPVAGQLTALSTPTGCGGFDPEPPCGARDVTVGDDGTIYAAIGPPVDIDGIYRFDPALPGWELLAPGTFPNPVKSPEAVAFAPSGMLYAINNTGVVEIDPISGQQRLVSEAGLIDRPNDIAIGPDGEIGLTLRTTSVPSFPLPLVLGIDPSNGAQRVVGADHLLREPRPIAVDALGRFLAGDGTAEAVIAFGGASDIQVPWVWGGPLVAPFSVDVDARGNLLLTGTDGLRRVDPVSGSRTRIAEGAIDVVQTPLGEIYVSGSGNGIRRIEPYAGTDVRLLESLGGTGRITNEPGGALLVTTSDNDLVRISGAGIAESLIDPPALFRFEGVYAPESGEIYVVDHRGATGSSGQGGLLRYNPVTSQADVIATGLGFPEAGDVTDDGTLVIANLAGSIQEWDPVTPAFLDAYSGGAGPRDVELWRGCSREAPCGDVDLDGHVSLLDPLLLRELLAGRGTLSDAQLARCSVVTPGTCSMVDVVALERLLAPGSLAPGLADICDTSL